MEKRFQFSHLFRSPFMSIRVMPEGGGTKTELKIIVDSINITWNPHLIKIVYDDICFDAPYLIALLQSPPRLKACININNVFVWAVFFFMAHNISTLRSPSKLLIWNNKSRGSQNSEAPRWSCGVDFEKTTQLFPLKCQHKFSHDTWIVELLLV